MHPTGRWSDVLLFSLAWSVGSTLMPAFCMAQSPPAAVPSPAEKVFSGHLDAVTMGAFTPDGNSVVTASFDQTARLWDVASQAELRQYAQHTGPIFCLAVSGDGATLATGAQDNTLRIWDVPPGQPMRVFSGHTKAVHAIAIDPLGERLVSASADQSVGVHSLGDRDEPSSGRAGHSADVLAVGYRPDGAYFASADASGRVLLWSPYLQPPQGEWMAGDQAIRHLQFTSNSQQLLTAGDDGVLRSWQGTPAEAKRYELAGAPWTAWSLIGNLSQAVCLAEGGKAFVWDVASGEVSKEFPKLDFKATAIAHTPNHAWVYIGDDAGKAHLVDFVDGSPRGHVVAHQGKVNDVAVHPDSVRFATCGDDGSVHLWTQPVAAADQTDTDAPQTPLQTWKTTPAGNVAATAIAFTPDQQHLLCGAADGQIRQWNIASGELVREIVAVTDSDAPTMVQVVITPNAETIVALADDKTLRTWKLSDGSPQKVMAHDSSVRHVSVSADSTRAAVACDDGIVRVWELSTGQLLQSLTGHTAAVIGVGYLADGQTVVSASRDQSVRWVKTPLLRAFAIHDGAVRSMALQNGGAQTVTCGDDKRIVATNVSDGSLLRPFRHRTNPADAEEAVYAGIDPTVVTTRADNQRVAAGSEAGEVIVWNSSNGEAPLFTLSVGAAVTAMEYSPDNQKLAVATAAGVVHLFGPSIPGQQPASELTAHQKFTTDAVVRGLRFANDNLSIYAALDNGQIQQWRCAGIAQRRQLAHGGPVYGAALSDDGKLAVTCSSDQTVRVWDTTTGQQKAQLRGHVGTVHAIAISRDETFAVTSGADGTLRLWDIVGGRQLKQLTQFDDTMYSIAIHPGGQLVAAAGADRMIHLLDLISGEERQTLKGHSDYIHCVAFDAAGNRLLSYGYAGHLKIWNPQDGKLLHESRVGKVGNYAQFSPNGKRLLLSNGDATARVIADPSQPASPAPPR